MSSAQNQYVFEASLPALSYSTYYFQAKTLIIEKKKPRKPKVKTTVNEACILQNEV